jgi:DNA (cytosine-5)-methyltransferase 1
MECATLQDFPPDHPWQGTQTSRYRQVGNAVPPTLARVVGGAVAEAIVRANVEGA